MKNPLNFKYGTKVNKKGEVHETVTVKNKSS